MTGLQIDALLSPDNWDEVTETTPCTEPEAMEIVTS